MLLKKVETKTSNLIILEIFLRNEKSKQLPNIFVSEKLETRNGNVTKRALSVLILIFFTF